MNANKRGRDRPPEGDAGDDAEREHERGRRADAGPLSWSADEPEPADGELPPGAGAGSGTERGDPGPASEVSQEIARDADAEADPPRPGKEFAERSTRPWVRLVGIAFVVVALIGGANAVLTHGGGVVGPDPGKRLAEFAVPSVPDGPADDANVAQPGDGGQSSACRIHARGAIRVCDLYRRPLLLSFWFTRGGNCEGQQDVVDTVARRERGRLNVLSVNIRDPRTTVDKLQRSHHWTMALGHDRDGAVSNLLAISACPTFVLVRPGGAVERTLIGDTTVAELTRQLRPLLGGGQR